MTLAVGIVALLIAAAISSGWIAFVVGVVIAALLVALISRFSGGYRRSGVFRRRRGGRARAGRAFVR